MSVKEMPGGPEAASDAGRKPVAEKPPKRPRSLPRYGWTYFNHLVAEYEALPEGEVPAAEKAEIEAILARETREPLTWKEIYELELLLLQVLPERKLRREVWSLRAQYRSVAAAEEYAAYDASKPPPADAEPVDLLRADLEHLLGRVHFLYALRTEREALRSHVSRWLFIWAFGLSITALVMTLFQSNLNDFRVPLTMIIASMGATGAYVSAFRRVQGATVQGDPFLNLIQLEHGRRAVMTAPVFGIVFAVILHLIFVAGLVKGELFPSFTFLGHSDAGVHFRDFFLATKPSTFVDVAKVLVWSFLAGFAESLVPDVLDRLVASSARQPAGKTAQTPI